MVKGKDHYSKHASSYGVDINKLVPFNLLICRINSVLFRAITSLLSYSQMPKFIGQCHHSADGQ